MYLLTTKAKTDKNVSPSCMNSSGLFVEMQKMNKKSIASRVISLKALPAAREAVTAAVYVFTFVLKGITITTISLTQIP